MKNKSFFASVAGLAVLFLVNACQKPAMEEPSIMLSLSSVPVTAEGGDFDVAFKVSNPPADNGAVTAELADPNAAEWVTGLTVNEEKSTVEFHVEPSKTPEQRTAEVTVSCAGAEDASFTIVQEPGVPDPFTFTLKDKSFKSVTFDLIPEDKDMYYFTAFTTQSYLDAYGLTTDEALYQDDIDYYGSNFGNYLGQGDQTDITYDAGIIPATDYVAYVYGVDPDSYERLTDIVYLKVTTDQVELVDVDFSIDIVKDGAGFTFSVDPGTYDGYWNAMCAETASLDPEVSLFELVSSAWNNQAAAYLSYGYEPEEILQSLCLKGANGSLYFQNIKPETAYTVIVFAVNSDAFASSEPAVVEVTTGAVSASDNEIEVSVDRVSGSTAMLHIATSNDDPYGFTIFDAASVEGMSDDEILAAAIAGNFYTNEGPLDTKFTGMEPEHSYKAVAFGYEAGEATTGLSSCDFTTTAGVSGSIDFELQFDAFYDIAATAEALTAAGYAEDGEYVESLLSQNVDCLMPVTPVTDPEVGMEIRGSKGDRKMLSEATGIAYPGCNIIRTGRPVRESPVVRQHCLCTRYIPHAAKQGIAAVDIPVPRNTVHHVIAVECGIPRSGEQACPGLDFPSDNRSGIVPDGGRAVLQYGARSGHSGRPGIRVHQQERHGPATGSGRTSLRKHHEYG